jgi:rSAM/selenodomain-associated transferase 1
MLNRLGSLLSTARLCPWHFAVAGKLEVGVFYAYGNEPRLQRGEDLGERMRYAAEDCFAGGTEFVLLVGGDVPALSAKLLERAIKALEGASDVVFVPAQDGGYVLLGMRRMIPELFEGPEWGGENVLAKSLEILKDLGLRAECLETLWDVDVPADLALLEQLDPPLDWAC